MCVCVCARIDPAAAAQLTQVTALSLSHIRGREKKTMEPGVFACGNDIIFRRTGYHTGRTSSVDIYPSAPFVSSCHHNRPSSISLSDCLVYAECMGHQSDIVQMSIDIRDRWEKKKITSGKYNYYCTVPGGKFFR